MKFVDELRNLSSVFFNWTRRNRLHTFLLAAIIATIIYFFGLLQLFANHSQAVWPWAWMRFLSQYNQEHSKLIPFIVLFLIWYHRKAIASASRQSSNLGWFFLIAGILFYIIGARALQPRVSLFGFPFLIFGIVLLLWGRKVARILLFPTALLFFMIPLGAIEQTTFRLQLLVIYVVTSLSHLFHIPIHAVGTSLQPDTNDWGFDIAEGCSGIRSLIAMVMITAVYVHLCQRELWKRVTILCFSVVFALIGNAGRIFTIIVLARLGFPKFAGGAYHDWSDWFFFPIALLSMLAFARLLNFRARSNGPPKESEAVAVAHDY
jgi:exosortase